MRKNQMMGRMGETVKRGVNSPFLRFTLSPLLYHIFANLFHISIISLCIIATALLQSACKINYSFTGASISPEVKTVSVQYFPNYAPLVQPTLSQALTEALKDRFLSETNLTLVENYGDLNFEGSITNYSIKPIAIQANETAAQNRLTITIKVKFINTKDEKQNFETTFTRYTDYLSSQNLSEVEEELIKEINDQLVEDIFNKAVVNW